MRRLLLEAREPVTAPGRVVRNTLAAIEAALRWPIRHLRRDPNPLIADTLYAFYDLEVMPLTYDIASFLALADLERKRLNLSRLHVIVVPAADPHRSLVDRGWRPPESNDQRILGILLPVLHLAASCRGQTLCATRAEAASWRFDIATHVFPAAYSPSFPVSANFSAIWQPTLSSEEVFPLLRAGAVERGAIETALQARIGARAAVVISLRESSFMPLRNSNIEAWIAFADSLDPERFAPVFVRDTDHAFEHAPPGLARHLTFEAASWNTALRMALYETAYVNLAIMHGPMELCWYNAACRYVAFLPVGTSPQTTPEFLASRGFRPGQSLPFARPWQRLAWMPDDSRNIESEFALMQRLVGVPPLPASQ